MENYYDKEDRHREELRRFYNQQKSTRKECNYGYKNCSTCKEENCKIRQFVEN